MIVQVLPWGSRRLNGADLHLTLPRIVGFIVVMLSYLVAGGLVAYVIGNITAARHAIAYGLGWHKGPIVRARSRLSRDLARPKLMHYLKRRHTSPKPRRWRLDCEASGLRRS